MQVFGFRLSSCPPPPGASDGVMLEIPVLRNASSEAVELFREWLQFQVEGEGE